MNNIYKDMKDKLSMYAPGTIVRVVGKSPETKTTWLDELDKWIGVECTIIKSGPTGAINQLQLLLERDVPDTEDVLSSRRWFYDSEVELVDVNNSDEIDSIDFDIIELL